MSETIILAVTPWTILQIEGVGADHSRLEIVQVCRGCRAEISRRLYDVDLPEPDDYEQHGERDKDAAISHWQEIHA